MANFTQTLANTINMKFEIVLFIVLFVFPFENFGQVVLDIPQKDTVSVFLPFGRLGQLDSCSTTNKKNDKTLHECYNKENQIIKSRILTKVNFSRKWNRKTRQTTWDENGKKRQKIIIRQKYIYFDLANMVPGRNSNLKEIKSITWYFRNNGKLCLKRKKETRSIRYPTN